MNTLESERADAKQWPDFYAVLETAPTVDEASLRRLINDLYQRANGNSDHRELRKRFYFQVLTQKVLPQCRRILLDSEVRAAYDAQWQLHKNGAAEAIAYGEFIKRLTLTHKGFAASLTELGDDEFNILPLVDSAHIEGAQIPSIDDSTGATTTVLPFDGEAPAIQTQGQTATVADMPVAETSVAQTPVIKTSDSAKKSALWPLMALGAVAVLAVGAWMWSRSNPAVSQSATAGTTSENSDTAWKPVGGYIMTKWASEVTPDRVLPEYPRPQLQRKSWQNLNGLWDYAVSERAATAAPANFDGQILVPFPYESALSGVGKAPIPDRKLWYRRSFSVPADWQVQRVILHFGAVNWDANVRVNGQRIGAHRGGYDAFEFDVTDALQAGENTLEVAVSNPLDVEGGQIVGKQRVKSEGINYSASTGIWQTVWLEPVPATHIDALVTLPDIDTRVLHLTAQVAGAPSAKIHVAVSDGGRKVAAQDGAAGQPMTIPIANPKLWTPDAPHLYDLHVTLVNNGKETDGVTSYFAMRKTSVARDAKGVMRLMLNNRFLMQRGVLDQGYWPDGLYTAPSDAALKYDIEMTKKLGFNMCRKHAKVEPERWYYHADKLGLLVWQDMPQMFVSNPSPEQAAQFKTEWQRIIQSKINHPSIVVWTPFNEGWGQHATGAIVDFTRGLDASRPVDEASGWNDTGAGDIADAHSYPQPQTGKLDGKRASVAGEFGGIGLALEGHSWNTDQVKNYGTARGGWNLTRQYQTLMQQAHALRDKGASAFVYTQLTDVEQETNGLLTYDRKIVKADLKNASAATRGQFLPLPANPAPDLLPTAVNVASVWAYHTDKPAGDWMRPAFNAQSWKRGPGGFGAGEVGAGRARTPWTTPDIWLRRQVELPEKLPEKLSFVCEHDEDIEIYVNGVLAAQASGYVTDYVELPLTPAGRAALKPGLNLLAVHCHQTDGGQYVDVGLAPG